MERATVKDIADKVGVDRRTVTRWCNRGLIKCNRDFRNWRYFANPDETIRQIQQMLNGENKAG